MKAIWLCRVTKLVRPAKLNFGMDAWNPDQYNKFQMERELPFWDLASKVKWNSVQSMLDVGCGTGEATRRLHLERGVKSTLGIDSSEEMLKKARTLPQTPGLEFHSARIEDYVPGRLFDLVFSNAALQWIEDHRSLIPRLLRWLSPGGQLAVQMPVNFDHPSHLVAEELGLKRGLKSRFPPVLSPEDYATMLAGEGLEKIEVSVRVYLHPMDSVLGVVEWTKATLLTHYQKQMTPEAYGEFLKEYSDRLLAKFGEGRYLYPFKRIFLVGTNPKKLG